MSDVIAGLLVIVAVFYGIFKMGIYWGTQECVRWGGEYHWSTGCIMEVDGARVALADYKQIQYASVAKPIPTNQNMNVSMELK